MTPTQLHRPKSAMLTQISNMMRTPAALMSDCAPQRHDGTSLTCGDQDVSCSRHPHLGAARERNSCAYLLFPGDGAHPLTSTRPTTPTIVAARISPSGS